MKTAVVNIRRAECDVPIHRGTIWGNPFRVGVDGDRAAVIAKFEVYIKKVPALMAALPELKGKTLGCWCPPKPCHGDVLVRLAEAV